ncbi:MAG: prepilin-type N-terminal cleavage/methylation domain-containing protein [Gemmatimonadota bacterium]
MRPRAGFTLIEMIVGLTVAGVVFLAGFAALATVQDRGAHVEETGRHALAGATQRKLLMDWLAGSRFRAPTGEQFEGIEGEGEGGLPQDLLLFPTTARTPLNNRSTVVGIYIDEDPDTPERGLVAEMTGLDFTAEPRRMELVPQAGAMQIRYYPETEGVGEWVDGWVGNSLPRGVEITLWPVAGDSLPALLRLPLRVALASLR